MSFEVIKTPTPPLSIYAHIIPLVRDCTFRSQRLGNEIPTGWDGYCVDTVYCESLKKKCLELGKMLIWMTARNTTSLLGSLFVALPSPVCGMKDPNHVFL